MKLKYTEATARHYTYYRSSPRGNTFEMKTVKCNKHELDEMCKGFADELLRRYGGGIVVASTGYDVDEYEPEFNYLQTITLTPRR